MLDALPLDQYKTNYRDIIHDQPLEYGNMKGLVLDKERFRRDFDDFDVLLRKNVPGKYKGYFSLPGNAKKCTDTFNDPVDDEEVFDDDYTDDIEYGRSSPSKGSYKLSPIKKQSHRKIPSISIKDSEDLKAPEGDIFHISKRKGRRHENLRPYQQLRPTNGLDTLVEQTYRYIDENLKGDTQLNTLVNDLVERLRSLESQEHARRLQERKKLEEEGDIKESEQPGRSQEEWIELLKVFQQKLAKYKSKNLSLQLDIGSLEDKVNSLKMAKSHSSSEFEDSDSEYTQLQSKLGIIKKELASAKKEVKDMKTEEGKKKDELEKLSSKVKEKKSALEELVSELDAKGKELESTIAKIQEEKDTLCELERKIKYGRTKIGQNSKEEAVIEEKQQNDETETDKFKDDPELMKLNEEIESLKEKQKKIIEKRRREREEVLKLAHQMGANKITGPVININFPTEFSDKIAFKVSDAILSHGLGEKKNQKVEKTEPVFERKEKASKEMEETTNKENTPPYMSSPMNLGKECPACDQDIYARGFEPRRRTTRPYSAEDDIRKYGFRGSARLYENGNSLRSNDSFYRQPAYGAVW